MPCHPTFLTLPLALACVDNSDTTGVHLEVRVAVDAATAPGFVPLPATSRSQGPALRPGDRLWVAVEAERATQAWVIAQAEATPAFTLWAARTAADRSEPWVLEQVVGERPAAIWVVAAAGHTPLDAMPAAALCKGPGQGAAYLPVCDALLDLRAWARPIPRHAGAEHPQTADLNTPDGDHRRSYAYAWTRPSVAAVKIHTAAR